MGTGPNDWDSVTGNPLRQLGSSKGLGFSALIVRRSSPPTDDHNGYRQHACQPGVTFPR